MKKLRIFGLLLFILSFLLFCSTLFLGQFTISETSIKKAFPDSEISSKVIDFAQKNNYFNKKSSTSFDFNSKIISSLILNYNHQTITEISNTKGISKTEFDNLITISTQNNQVNYNKLVLEKVFLTNLEKIKLLENATSWMFLENKTFNSKEEFISEIEKKVTETNANFASNLIINDTKYTRFDLVKASATGLISNNKILFLFLTFGLGILGSLLFIVSALFLSPLPGIKNNGIYLQSATNKGWVAYIVFGFLVVFYILLYFYPYFIANWTLIVDPLKSIFVINQGASQWFLYGVLYCVSMLVMGIRMLIKYRHNSYQIFRTLSVLFFQIVFAFLLVEIFPLFGLPGVDLKNAWPLDYNFLTDWNVKNYFNAGHLGKFMFFWGILLSIIIVPIMVYFFGKRWYCSWVCGCGGLAETLGDPYRQLSDKRLIAWKTERFTIYPILVFAILMTIVVGLNTYNIINSPNETTNSTFFGINAYKINEWYGFLIGSIFAGVIGTGFYPILGNRTWCRFGCPLAAYMGLIQRFKSKFRITTNSSQCISCGNCSTYCEQGIDVRAYAQKGIDIVRASCVGCGVCAAVCPRGVLKLENSNQKAKSVSNFDSENFDLMQMIQK